MALGLAGGGGGAGTLQASYDVSGVAPHITTTLAEGPLTIRTGVAAANILELQDFAGVTQHSWQETSLTLGPAVTTIIATSLSGVDIEPALFPGRAIISFNLDKLTFLRQDRTMTGTAPFEWTSTLTRAGGTFGGFVTLGGTFQFSSSASGFGMGNALLMSATWKNVSGVAANLGPGFLFACNTVFQADAAAITQTQARIFFDNTLYNTIGGGSLTMGVGVGHVTVWSSLRLDTVGVSVDMRRGLYFPDATVTNSATLTTQIAVDIDDLTAATTSIGIRSAMLTGTFIQHDGTAAAEFGGAIRFSAGAGAADVEIVRLVADIITLGAGDSLRVPNILFMGATGQVNLSTVANQLNLGTGDSFQIILGTIEVHGAGVDSERYGASTLAGGLRSTALGFQSSAVAQESLACGDTALVSSSATGGIALGNAATVGDSCIGSISIGDGSSVAADATGAVCIGFQALVGVASTSGISAIAIGFQANAAGDTGITIGASSASAGDGISIGFNQTTGAVDGAISIGPGTNATGQDSTCVGTGGLCNQARSVGIGNLVVVASIEAIGIGDFAQVGTTSDRSVCIGNAAIVGNAAIGAIAIGDGASVANSSTGTIIIGDGALTGVGALRGIGIGVGATVVASSVGAVVIGDGAQGAGTGPVAIGDGANSATQGTAIGNGADASTTASVAIGNGAFASNAFALGNGCTATNGVALGVNATVASGSNGIAVGFSTTTVHGNCIGIGSSLTVGSVSDTGSVVVGHAAFGANATDSIGIGRDVSVFGQDDVVAIGTSARGNVACTGAVVIGHDGSVANALRGIGIGNAVDVDGDEAIGIGDACVVAGAAAIGLGDAVSAAQADAIGVGRAITTDAADQVAIRGTEFVLGSLGPTSAAPLNVTWRITDGVGTDIAAADLTIASGRGTGLGAVSDLIFQTPDVLGTGAVLQTAVTRLLLSETVITLGSASNEAVTIASAGGSVGHYGTTPVVQAAVINLLTDNSGGTANDTIALITNAANAGSADVGPTQDAIADMAAKINAILAVINSATGVGLSA